MKKIIGTILICITLLLTSISAIAVDDIIDDISIKINNDDFVSGEVIIKFKNGIENKVVDQIDSTYGLTPVLSDKNTGFQRYEISREKSVLEMVEILNKNPNIEYAEPNYIAHACMVPNDPYYSYQWHMHDLDEGGINMEPAWDISTGVGAVVAIVDTGISVGSDLSSTCFVSGYDFVNNDNNPTDDNGHGTHVAGTVAQSTNNNNGVVGVAFGACLMPVKVLNRLGSGTYTAIANGIYYAVDHGANIISMSLGGSYGSTTLLNAVAYAYNHGVTVIAASGNDGINGVSYPAAYDSYVIAVGATQYDKTRAPYSNYGSSLDVVAPGGNLDVDQNGDGYGDGVLQQTFSGSTWGYYFFDGTSMATPHVSGVAALLYSTGVTSPDGIRSTLQETAVDLGTSGWDMYYGYGLINAYNALTYGQSNNPPTCTLSADPTSGIAPLLTTFYMEASDSDGTIASWALDINNDGNAEYSGSGYPPATRTHTYNNEGTYTAKLTVWDDDDANAFDTETIIVSLTNNPPNVPTNPNPSNGATDVSLSPTLSVYAYDADGDTMYVSFYAQGGALIGSDIVSGSGTATAEWASANQYSTTYYWYTVASDGIDQTTSATWSFTTEEEPSEVVEFFDSFEYGQWNGLWVEDSQNDWFTSTQRKTDGSYSAEVDGSATDATLTMSNAIDLSGKSGATLTFSWFIESSWDRGEYIALDVYNGATWTQITSLRGNVDTENVWHHETINLAGYLNSNFKIRFRARVSSSSEDGNVDNVKIISYA